MALDPNTFTRKTGEAIGPPSRWPRERSHSQVTPEHLLAALLGQPESVVIPTIERLGVSTKTLRDRVDAELGRLPQAYGQTAQQAQLSPAAYAGARGRRRGSARTSATTTSPPSTCSSR